MLCAQHVWNSIFDNWNALKKSFLMPTACVIQIETENIFGVLQRVLTSSTALTLNFQQYL